MRLSGMSFHYDLRVLRVICVFLCACVVSYCVLRMWVEYTIVILVCYELVTGGIAHTRRPAKPCHTHRSWIDVVPL